MAPDPTIVHPLGRTIRKKFSDAQVVALRIEVDRAKRNGLPVHIDIEESLEYREDKRYSSQTGYCPRCERQVSERDDQGTWWCKSCYQENQADNALAVLTAELRGAY